MSKRRIGLTRRWIALVLCASACAWGCSGPETQESDLDYMVMFDGDGTPIDPMRPHGGGVLPYSELEESEYAERVDSIITNIEKSELKRVVIFIHGGLNTQPESIERAVDLHQQIVDDGAYPIFVNWQSNLYSSYRDHLLWLRRGREGSAWELALAPVYLVEDVVTGLIRFPIVAFSQLVEFAGLGSGSLAIELPDHKNAKDAWKLLSDDTREHGQAGHLRLNGTFEGSPSHVYWTWIPTLPAKLVSIPVVSMAGPGSWDEMQHRVEVLFCREKDHEGEQIVEINHGLLYLMTELAELQREHTDIEVDLVGHSMGTIVMNRILFRGRVPSIEPPETEIAHAVAQSEGTPPEQLPHGEQQPVQMPTFTNVVYLAAACNLRDCAASVFPYLEQHPETRLFNVTLHPKAELAESNWFDIAPRGSLLVWIDDFLANPIGQGERTAGRADNLAVVLYLTPPEIRDRVYVNVLPLDDERFPQEHGDFTNPCDTKGNFKFWDRASWFPEASPASPGSPAPGE